MKKIKSIGLIYAIANFTLFKKGNDNGKI